MKHLRIIDIGANLIDGMYKGLYNGKLCHQDDINNVILRSFNHGLEKIISTSGSLNDCRESLNIIGDYENIYTTVGCHPTRCNEFEKNDPESYLNELSKLISEHCSKVVAIGECGLDYDRLHFCPKDVQRKYFNMQLRLASQHGLPMFLHSRNCHQDFLQILKNNSQIVSANGGVVHSFTGSLPEANEILNFSPNLYIGINGCSLKTEDNINVVKNIPFDRIMIETDAPWCEIKATHASYKYVKTHFKTVKKEKYAIKPDINVEGNDEPILVKGRNEPCTIIQVLEVLQEIFKSSDLPQNKEAASYDTKIGDTIYQTTQNMFFKKSHLS